MKCTGCRFRSNKSGAQFSAGEHIFCLYDRLFHPREHGCSRGEKRSSRRQAFVDNPIIFTE